MKMYVKNVDFMQIIVMDIALIVKTQKMIKKMPEKIYRITITVQEYYNEGFWNVFDKTEMLKGKSELIESFLNLSDDCKNYIEKRLS